MKILYLIIFLMNMILFKDTPEYVIAKTKLYDVLPCGMGKTYCYWLIGKDYKKQMISHYYIIILFTV
jgi:hypothetical protein